MAPKIACEWRRRRFVAKIAPVTLALPDWRQVGIGALVALAAALVGLISGTDPALAVALALAAAYVLVAFSSLTAAVILFTCEPLGLGVEESTVFRLAAVALFLATIVLVASREDRRGDFLAEIPVVTWLLVALLGWMLMSLAWAQSASEAWIALGRLAAGVAVFLATYAAVTERRAALAVYIAFCAAAAGAIVIGLVAPTEDLDSVDRLHTAFFDPNELAFTLVAAIALGGGLIVALRRPEARIAATAGVALAALGLVLTVSRGGLIALGVALVAAIVFGGRWRGRLALAGLMLIAATVVYFSTVAPNSARERVTEISQGQIRLEGRTTIWTVGWRQVKQNPVAGVGAGNFKTTAREYLRQPGAIATTLEIIRTPKVAHNIYLEILAELGIIGFLLFGAVILFCLRCAFLAARAYAARGDPAGEAMSRAALVAAIGMLAAGFFISQEYDKQLWLVLALGPAMLAISRREAPEET